MLFNKGKTTLVLYPTGRTAPEYEIPDSVISICDCVFDFYINLKSIKIEKNVENIGKNAFNCCCNLEEIKIENGSQLQTIYDEQAFGSCDKLSKIIYIGSERNFNKINIHPTNYDALAKAEVHCYHNDYLFIGKITKEGLINIKCQKIN